MLTGLADPGGSCTLGSIGSPCTTYSYDNASSLINLVAVQGTCTTGSSGSVTSTGTVLQKP